MKKNLKFCLRVFLFLQLCAILTILVPATPPARAETTLPSNQFSWCGSTRVCVNPRDGSLWVAYGDTPIPIPTIYYVGHFSKEGVLLKTLQLPANRYFLTITFEPGDDRLYYEEFSSLVFTAFGYIDLQTGETHKMFDTETIAGGCRANPPYSGERWYYNAARKQFYLPCTSYYNATGRPEPPTRTAVVDTTNGKVVQLVDFQVLALHPDGGKVYAYKEYYETISQGYDQKFYDVFLVNDQTFAATSDKPLIKHQQEYTALTSFKVNSRTGLVYLTNHFCYAKCGAYQGAVVDRTGNFVVPFSTPKLTQFTAINEANNQVYGFDYFANQFGRTELDAFDGSNTMGERLAQFYWQPLAIDQARNLIYASTTGGVGFGLVVVNGNTNSVSSFIKVQPPDTFYTDKAKPSPPPPGPPGLYFTETGHGLNGKFLDFWQKNGGLASLGFPITEPFEEYNPDLNRNLTVQYFERIRLELHPENAGTPYEIEMGLLGHNFSALTGPRVNQQFGSGETSPVEGGLLFKETGHTVSGKFLEYWQTHGGLTRHGLPLTQPTYEVNPIDGKTYLVQYFERSRLELHPEFTGTEYEVLLGLLGTQSLRAHAWPV